ncbi:MAG TPA: PAS domain-containing protein, partial [Flavisolibacter sp.]|nr:PAS domain-containing protein [Flavisolibacter sp.]
MQHSIHSLNILVVEDNPGDLILFNEYLLQTELLVNKLLSATDLKKAQELAPQQKLDIVFLDLSLPDSEGIETFYGLYNKISSVPIVILSGQSDISIALECISKGAQDYLLKDELTPGLLKKSISYSIERKKNLESLRESNERYEFASKASFDVIWDWNIANDEVYWNEAFQTYFGYHLNSQTTGMDEWIKHIHPHDKERVTRNIKNAIKNHRTNWQDEYRFIKADNSIAYINDRGLIIRDSSGKAFRIIGAKQDITENKKLQEEIINNQLNVQKQLTEATILAQEHEREELGKELHDNINQVLATVKLYLEVGKKNENMREEMIQKCNENLKYVIEEIRKLSKSLVPPALEDRGLIEVLNELVDDVNYVAPFFITLNTGNFDEQHLDNAFKLMLYRIVQEQINNIVKYAKATEVIILLKIYNNTIVLSIADNGVGFDVAKKRKGIGLRNITNRIAYYS